MADKLISQNTAVNTILDLCSHMARLGSMDEYGASCLCGAAVLVKAIPAVDAAPVVHAKWILIQNGSGVCSACNRNDHIDSLAAYCRYCGARMDGGADDGK